MNIEDYRRRHQGAFTPCDRDPQHGRGVRNPGTKRNEFLCVDCHRADGLLTLERC